MNGEILARFIVTEVLCPMFQIIIVIYPALWMAGGYRAKEGRGVKGGAASRARSDEAGQEGTSYEEH